MTKIIVKCDWCGNLFEKYAKKLTEHNYCCKNCRINALSLYNKTQNPINKSAYWTKERRQKARKRNLGKGNGKSYSKYYGQHTHRVMAEIMLGRKLTANEIVHHINGNKLDNRFENLMVMTQSEHVRLHLKRR